MPNLISTPRIVWFGIFSFGLYIFYWFYLTWKHYRDHAGRDAYPVWHALTLAVPIYNFFRLHAHMRVYKDLMSDSRVPSTLKPGTFVIVFAISWLLTLLNNAVESIEGAAESLEFLVVSMLLLATSLALNIWVMAQVQGNLNRYWNSLPNVKAVNAPIGVGEVILVIVGVAIFLLSFLIGFVEGVSEL